MSAKIVDQGSSARLLDAVDDVRKKLAALRAADDTRFYERILSDLPQFVACGAQSAGKSSVIRAVSGIPLPEASTLCTRMETMIEMRRKSQELLRVVLLGPDGKEMRSKDLSVGNKENVREAVATFQDEVTQKKHFVDDHLIVVQVHGPTCYNGTLVDLPGFHTADDAESERVTQMVQRKIVMPGTLVLHVVKGDQDYGSLLGNDFMRKHTRIPRVTVLTHCDNLVGNRTHQEMLQHTLDETSRASSGTFAVVGRLSGDNCADAELDKLKDFEHVDMRLQIGRRALAKHIDQRISEHVRHQYPKALATLEEELQRTEVQLEVVRERAPAEALLAMVRKIECNFREGRQRLLNDTRRILEKMDADIRSFRLGATSGGRKSFDILDDLAPGEIVMYKKGEDEEKVLIVSCSSSNEFTLRALSDGAIFQNVALGDLFSADACDTSSMCEDIQVMAEDRGLRNLSHIDIHPVIVHYSALFAKHYRKALDNAQLQIRNLIDSFLRGVILKDTPAITRDVAAEILSAMAQMAKEVDNLAHTSIEAIQAGNSHPDLVFTPNNHYLSSVAAKLYSEKQESFADKLGDALRIVCEVRAFIKVQRKAVAEVAAKELVRIMVLGTEQRFDSLLRGSLSRYEAWVREPEELVRQRTLLRARKPVLEEALGILKAAMSRTGVEACVAHGSKAP